MAVSNNGFTRIPTASNALRTITVGGRSTRVRRGAPAVLLQWVANQLNDNVEPVETLFGWRSAALNSSVGGVLSSNHLSGTAIDYNGARHPYEKRNPRTWKSGWSAEDVRRVRGILAGTKGTVRWGLDFNPGYRDGMHFEVKASSAAIEAAAKRLRGGTVRVTRATTGRAVPILTGKVKYSRKVGFKITYVTVAYRGGQLWLKTRYNTWYEADHTSF
jgi:hypothetical protein